MKSIAGNIVPAFGPIAVKVIFDVGGVHNGGAGITLTGAAAP
jgi:hypothetical protein